MKQKNQRKISGKGSKQQQRGRNKQTDYCTKSIVQFFVISGQQ